MNRMTSKAAVVGAFALVFSAHAPAQTANPPERFSATAINMNAGAEGVIEIAVNKWSSDADRDRLMNVMRQQGPSKLLDVLTDMPRMGYFRPGTSLGWDIHFARRITLPEGGERVVLLTDRPISFRESLNQTRSLDYPFTVIELRLNKDGRGEGKINLATKIIVDEESNIVTLEDYDLQPVMLKNVKREDVKHT